MVYISERAAKIIENFSKTHNRESANEKFAPGNWVQYDNTRKGGIDSGVVVSDSGEYLIINVYGDGNKRVKKSNCF